MDEKSESAKKPALVSTWGEEFEHTTRGKHKGQQTAPFVAVSRDVIELMIKAGVRPSEVLIVQVIMTFRHPGSDAWPWPSYSTIASYLDRNGWAVGRAVRRLKKVGLLTLDDVKEARQFNTNAINLSPLLRKMRRLARERLQSDADDQVA